MLREKSNTIILFVQTLSVKVKDWYIFTIPNNLIIIQVVTLRSLEGRKPVKVLASTMDMRMLVMTEMLVLATLTGIDVKHFFLWKIKVKAIYSTRWRSLQCQIRLIFMSSQTLETCRIKVKKKALFDPYSWWIFFFSKVLPLIPTFCVLLILWSYDLQCRSCTETNFEANPWWGVDLGTNLQIHHVDVTNRGDCCREINNELSLLSN